MSDYPRSAGDTLTEEERQYYRSNSQDAIQLRKDLCKMLGICLTTAGAAAVAAIIANYSTKGGTRKRSIRKSIRRRRGAHKKRSMRKHMRKHATRRR
jgi:hypothetical protein